MIIDYDLSNVCISLQLSNIQLSEYLWGRELLATIENNDINGMETVILDTFF